MNLGDCPSEDFEPADTIPWRIVVFDLDDGPLPPIDTDIGRLFLPTSVVFSESTGDDDHAI